MAVAKSYTCQNGSVAKSYTVKMGVLGKLGNLGALWWESASQWIQRVLAHPTGLCVHVPVSENRGFG